MHNTKRKCVLVVSTHTTKQRVRYNAHQRIANTADRRINCQLNDGSACMPVPMRLGTLNDIVGMCGMEIWMQGPIQTSGLLVNFLTGGTDL